MFIKRVCVEEGFLDGLDLKLDEGLTVLIGARGSGKTSIIELIRFCLDAPSYSTTSGETSLKQALAVLGSGKVTVTLDEDGEEITVSRSAEEMKPRRSSERTFSMPIVLSQSQVEQIGLHPDTRLRLLDGFVWSLRDNQRAEEASRALIASLTVELRAVLVETSTTQQEVDRLAALVAELDTARLAANEASQNIEQTADQRARLEQLGQLTATSGVRSDLYERAERAMADRLSQVRPLTTARPLDPWPVAAGTDDHLGAVRASLLEAEQFLRSAEAQLSAGLTLVHELGQNEQTARLALEDEARTLRGILEQLTAGAGALVKKVSDLEAAQQRAAALQEHLAHLGQRATDIVSRRETALDQLDELRDARVNAREEAALFLNVQLGPRIRVTVNRFGSVEEYADAIANGLRGSGLQYNLLAPELAPVISPRELARAAEYDDPEAVVSIAGIAYDRAQKLVSHLREFGTEAILTAPLGDTVDLALLDGGIYKSAEDLSVGQRCTAVLPIIMSHTERVIIVDQPEDNLDNSFIAETLVKALRNRPATSQLIFATHNPNVPVLGEANCVVYLTSDGRRGDIEHAGALDDVESVRAISDVMEGGREAFATRAAFYASEYPDDEQA